MMIILLELNRLQGLYWPIKRENDQKTNQEKIFWV